MSRLAYKNNNKYEGIVSYDNIKYTENELQKLKEEFFELEKHLTTFCEKSYNSEYCYELGLILSSKINEYKIIESNRYEFFKMLREYVNMNDKRKVFQEKQRDPYERCYQLSKLSKKLVTKYSMSKWDYLFDVTTARKDLRIYSWLEKQENEKFISSNDAFQNFCKGVKEYILNIDTDVFNDKEIYNLFDEIVFKSIILVEYTKNHKLKLNSEERSKYFRDSKIIKNKDVASLEKIIKNIYS